MEWLGPDKRDALWLEFSCDSSAKTVYFFVSRIICFPFGHVVCCALRCSRPCLNTLRLRRATAYGLPCLRSRPLYSMAASLSGTF